MTTTVLRLDIDFPRNPGEVDADVKMRELSALLGVKVSAAKIGGYWLMYREDELLTGRPEIGLPNFKNFDNAVSHAFNVTICRAVPFKK
jgi:hypothetical protein